MTTETELWKKINEPKILELIPYFDDNGKLIMLGQAVDRLPLGFIPMSFDENGKLIETHQRPDKKPKKRRKQK